MKTNYVGCVCDCQNIKISAVTDVNSKILPKSNFPNKVMLVRMYINLKKRRSTWVIFQIKKCVSRDCCY